MKFFDPKKKENNSVSSPDPVRPQPLRPAFDPLPSEPERTIPAAPTVSIPVPEERHVEKTLLPPAPTPQVMPQESKPPISTQRVGHTVLGNSVVIKGSVSSEENITIDGLVEGSVESVRDVFVGPDGRVQATIRATNVKISGKVKGDIQATNRVEITPAGVLEGNIHAPKLTIADSARFRGKVDMSPPPPVGTMEKMTVEEKPQKASLP